MNATYIANRQYGRRLLVTDTSRPFFKLFIYLFNFVSTLYIAFIIDKS